MEKENQSAYSVQTGRGVVYDICRMYYRSRWLEQLHTPPFLQPLRVEDDDSVFLHLEQILCLQHF